MCIIYYFGKRTIMKRLHFVSVDCLMSFVN